MADECLDAFKFYAIKNQTGLRDGDGILGLAPHEHETNSLLVQLHKNGMID